MFSTSKQRVYADEVADVLLDSCENDFNTGVEDGSAEQVAKLITTIWDQMQKGDHTLLDSTLNANVPKGSQSSIFQAPPAGMEDDEDSSDDSDDDEDDSGMASAPAPAPQQDSMDAEPTTDADGFTMVRRSSRRR